MAPRFKKTLNLDDFLSSYINYTIPDTQCMVLFTYIYHRNWPNVGKYTIHWVFGHAISSFFNHSSDPKVFFTLDLGVFQTQGHGPFLVKKSCVSRGQQIPDVSSPACFTRADINKKHGMLVQVTLPFLFWKRLKSLENTKNSYQPLLASFGGRKSAEQRVFLKTKEIESLSLVDVGFPVAREAKPVDLYLEVGKSDNNHAMFYFAFGTWPEHLALFVLLACLFVLLVCLFGCLFVCLFVCFVCLFVCSFVRPSVRPFVGLFVCLFVCLWNVQPLLLFWFRTWWTSVLVVCAVIDYDRNMLKSSICAINLLKNQMLKYQVIDWRSFHWHPEMNRHEIDPENRLLSQKGKGIVSLCESNFQG